MYNYSHEITLPTDIAMQKFLWSDYFHDSVITNIGFESNFKGQTSTRNTIKLTMQCDRDCSKFYHAHKNVSTTLDDERFTYFLYFTGVEYFLQECDMSLMEYLNGRFKSTQKLKELSAESTNTYYHFRIQTVGGFMDVIFKGFKLRKKVGRVDYSLDGYNFKPLESTISNEEKEQMELLLEDKNADDWDCFDALGKLHTTNDIDLPKYARLCLNFTSEELEDTKVYAAYLLGKLGDKADLQAIENLYFRSENLLEKKHLQDAIELLNAKIGDEK